MDFRFPVSDLQSAVPALLRQVRIQRDMHLDLVSDSRHQLANTEVGTI
jgi:hypothetical protein